MDTTTVATKPHAVCIPVPTQSHIKAMLKFAKLLHSRVTCTVSDGFMSPVTITTAQVIGVPSVQFYIIAACAFMGFIQFRALVEKGLAPLKDVLDVLSSMLPLVYPIGPFQLQLNQIPEHPLNTGYSLWKEETECLEWLNAKGPDSVMYVNFGSIAVMTPENLVEFGWGLAKRKLPFFWVIRPDLVIGESAIFPPEFVAETKERSLIAICCPQEQVLNHPSVGRFLTHSGCGSTIESLTAGVPMLCWPSFGDQQIDYHYTCNE
ncbi:hypothetical protein C1H46_036714 [Malus baccata]|uniref:UDP-glycosyltransferases domain-containing protein n=1 Tax=Malus baccata TaxID=106549 RepID=A0A540KU71_MALBA|nr:hypothetical protein C1H46_036714 [Malus baccata]